MADKETSSSMIDISQLRTPIQISGKPVEQVLSSIHYGSPELRCLLLDECDLIFECKVCRALFRDLPNFISHKRVYCTKSSMENRHVTIASLPEEKVVVIQPQAPEETERKVLPSTQQVRQPPKAPRPNLEDTITRIQSGELGRSHAYQVYTEAAEKLQRQKEGMKVATIRTTAIPTNKNAVFIDVNMTSVNIHERQQQAGVASYDQNRNDTSVTVIKRKSGDRHKTTRNIRKSVKQEKHSSEPQKLLLEQLKEIQQKRVRSAPQNRELQKDGPSPIANECLQKAVANQNTLRVQKKVSDNAGLKVSVYDNVQTVLDNEKETMINVKNTEEVTHSLVRRKAGNKIHPKADKTNQLHTYNSVLAVKTRKRFAEQSLICSKCSAVFATRKSLGYHMKIHHSTKRTFYPCPYCQSVFYYFYGITRHLFKNHDKTLEEVNVMRKLLREKSFTKPLSTPSLKNDTRGIVLGSLRSTRALGSNIQVNAMQSAGGVREDISVLSDKPVLKKDSGGHEITSSESCSKIARQKNAQLGFVQDELRHDLQSSITTGSEKSEDTFSANEESHSVWLKNKHQQRDRESSGKAKTLNNQAHSYTRRVTNTSSQTRSSVSRNHENTSHTCPKCRLSFRRKISCKNHMKVCNAMGRRSMKKLRSQNTGRKSRQGTESTTLQDKKVARVKRRDQTTSNDSAAKAEITGSDQISSSVKVTARKDAAISEVQGRLNDILKPTDSRNTQLSSGDRASNLTRRSSSMDRVIKHDEPRNRSHDRNSAGRDQRDSSVESTQSNVEGKSPRSRRNVLSRYATPNQPQKSPAKFDILLKTDSSNEGDRKIIESEILPHENAKGTKSDFSDNILNCDGEKTLKDYNEESSLKLENKSAIIPEIQTLNLPAAQMKAKSSSIVVKSSSKDSQLDVQSSGEMTITTAITREMSRATTLLQKSLESPQVLNPSPQKRQPSPMKSNLLLNSSPSKNSASTDKQIIPHKQLVSADRSILFQIMSSGPSFKSDTPSPNVELSKCESTLSSSESLEKDTAKSEFICAEKEASESNFKKDPWKLKKGVADLARLEYQSVWENSEIFKDSMMEMGTHMKKQNENSIKLMEQKGDSKANNLHMELSKQNEEYLDIKGSEMSSENTLKNSSGNPLENKISKPQRMPELAVVSALSERPKRKRKVPSRNRDAEEMLSKILGHSNQTVPVKKRKISLEPKTAVASKQKLKKDNIMEKTLSVADIDGKDSEVKINEAADVEKETLSDEVVIINDDDTSEIDDGFDDNDELGKVKGRFVSNRMYVLEKFGSKRKRLKCYDQVKVFKMIDEENLKCLACGESCTQVSNLRRHVIRQHLKWSRFKCKLCKFDSYDRSECTTHLIRGHRNLAINLRNVNRYIIDLVKQGSHARSIKKNQTIKVKQSQNQEENIYARPTVKKTLRLPQRAKEDSLSRPDGDPMPENRDEKKLDIQQSQTQNKDQVVTPAQNSAEVKPGLIVQDPKPVAVVVTLSRKQINTLTSSKVKDFSKQPNQQLTSKPGLAHPTDVKDVTLKATRKSLPFNISTRNSPRTFDTRPYNPEKECLPSTAVITSASNEEYPFPQTRKETLVKIVSPKEIQLKELHTPNANCLKQMETLPRDVTKFDRDVDSMTSIDILNADNTLASRNIFEKMRIQSTSCLTLDVTSLSPEDSGVVTRSAASTTEVKVVTSSTGDISSPSVFEVKIKNPRRLYDKPKYISQPPARTIKPAPVNVDNSQKNVISYILRGPQQKLTHVPDEVVGSDQLAKSLLKVRNLGNQISSTPASIANPEQILKGTLPATRVISSQIIDSTNLQQKPVYIPVSAASIGNVPTSSIAKVSTASIANVPAASVANVPAASIGMAPTSSIANVPATSIAKVPAASIAKVSTASIAKVPTTSIAKVSNASIANISNASIANVITSSIANVPAANIAKVSNASIANVPTASIANVPTSSIANVPTASIGKVSPASIGKVPTASIANVSAASIGMVSPASIGKVSTASIANVSAASIGKVSPAGIGNVPPASIANVSPASVGNVSVASIGKVSPASIGNVSFASIGKVSPASVGKVPVASVGKVSPASIRNVSVASIGKVSTTGVGKFPVASVGNVPVASVGKVSPDSIGNVSVASVGKVSPASAGKVPVASAGKVPAASVGKVPASTVGKVPASSVVNVPTASIGKAPSIEHVKLVPQRTATASKEIPGSSTSGMTLAAALTKSGHISSTSASSFILSHGQAGKYIIYTRPAGAKELTTVGSLIKPLAASSPLPSSSTSSVTVVSTPETKQGSETEETTTNEKAILPGTFVIRKHYL